MLRRICVASLLATGCGATEPARAPPPTPSKVHFAWAPETLAPDVTPASYRLELEVDPRHDRYSGRVEIDLHVEQAHDQIWLHARDVSVRGTQVRTSRGWTVVPFEQRSGMVQLSISELRWADIAAVRLDFDAPFASGDRGFMRSQSAGEWYTATILEQSFARDVFPCFDEPRFRTPFQVTLVLPETLVAVSNTPVRTSTPLSLRRRRVTFESTPPLPTYLVALAVGTYAIVDGPTVAPNEWRPRPLTLRAFVPRNARPHAFDEILRVAAEVLPDLERYTGMGYPFAKMDLIASPSATSGMENPGAIVVPGSWGDLAPGNRDGDSVREQARWVTHELAHMWFGDVVSIPTWTDLWTKEAVAEWLAARVLDTRYPGGGFGLDLIEDAHVAMVEDEWRERIVWEGLRPNSWRRAYDPITYGKGACVLGGFERWMGADKFRDGMRSFLRGHRFATATSEDLLRALSRLAGPEVDPAIRTFVTQAGVPLVEAAVECEGRRHELVVHQLPWHHFRDEGNLDVKWGLPICARYEKSGHAHEICSLVTSPEDRLPLESDRCPAWVHPNADAAGYYRWTLPYDDLDRLVQHRDALTIAERLSIEESVYTGFRRGTVTLTGALRNLERFASDSESRVVVASLPVLISLHETFTGEPPIVTAMAQYASRIYASAKARTSWTAAGGSAAEREAQAHRSRLLAFLAQIARDSEVRDEAHRRGRAYLGLDGDGKLHAEAVPSDLAPLALTVAVEDDGADVIDAVFERLRTTRERSLRRALIAAAGASRRPEARRHARAMILKSELDRDEIARLLAGQLQIDEARDETFRWMEEHAQALGSVLGAEAFASLYKLAGRACDDDHAAAALVKVKALPRDDPRVGPLASAAARIRSCAFLRTRHLDEARSFFTKQP